MAKDPRQVIEQFAATLTDKVIRQATVRSLNRTLTTIRAAASRKVTEQLKIKSADAKKAIVIRKAVPQARIEEIRGVIDVTGRPLPLSYFDPRPRTVKVRANRFGSTRQGVTVNIKGTRKLVQGAFLMALRTGHLAVAIRKGKGRTPTKELKTTSVVDIIKNPDVQEELIRTGREALAKNLTQDLKYLASRAFKRISGGA